MVGSLRSRPRLGRRNFLQAAGAGLAAAGTGLPRRGVAQTPARAGIEAPFDVAFTLRTAPGEADIRAGQATRVWRYTGTLQAGPADTLHTLGASYLGPLIQLRRGQRVRATIENGLDEDTTVHWHGLHVPPDVDGQPRLPIAPGARFTAGFEVADRAGLYWYHPHPHGPDGGRVGVQSYHGLAGALLIRDAVEDGLDLPAGAAELLLVLQDRSFDQANQLAYPARAGMPGGGMMGQRMAMMAGTRGDTVLVNGQPNARRTVQRRPYRLRVLNGSNARIYKLAYSDGRPVTVIGTDGGLLPSPERHDSVVLAPAQRLDLWVDFSADPADSTVELVSLAHDGGLGGSGMGMMGGGMMGGGSGSDMRDDGGMMGSNMMAERMAAMMGADRLALVRFDVARAKPGPGAPALPERLADDLPARPPTAARTRAFTLGLQMPAGFTLNGRRMAGPQAAQDETVKLGETELWEFRNDTFMPHPMHVHGLQFAVAGRTNTPGDTDLARGRVDSGLRDTVLVLPGERVQVRLTFADYAGLYMYHCHNMEHEDAGMMRYYRVRA